ncbi:NACHT domain-containing protein [Streptomyces sp. NBC_01618]|uniref:NACHT domain-containing protein n=1 Tax=Streptomyces sp. NBC_01618 TaxID=2975900 RepID=UPI00386AC6A0|nr:hypothetical protein OH735_29090 [Streptomyces sp. NBC_01618]
MAEVDGQLGPGRKRFKDDLRRLLQESRLTQIEAIGRANKESGATKLKKQTVSDWFAGNPPADFEMLWPLIQTLLYAAGHQTREDLQKAARSAKEPDGRRAREALGKWDVIRGHWEGVWEIARGEPGPGPDPRLRAYLTAARQAADDHPYHWTGDQPPPLGEIYVRQETRPENAPEITPKQAAAHSPQSEAPLGDGPASLPVEHVFEAKSCCVLSSGPGGGKSTQARKHLVDAADGWLQRLDQSKGDRDYSAVPVLVRASALADTTDRLPQALAKAMAKDLVKFAPLLDLTGLFDRHPLPKTPWLIIVDGLDEISNRDARTDLLHTVAAAAATHPSLYRFTVLTRPLPELDTLGPGTPRYVLQPFSPADLHDYARRCFHHRPDLSLKGEEHTAAFIAQLDRSRLDELARTPLMAFMLTQLYAANPDRSLPTGRGAAYGAFVDLVYNRNSHKNPARTHAAALRRLVDRHQEPAERGTAEQAAGQAAEHLTEIIDYLAAQRLHGDTDLAARIAATHPHAKRPKSIGERDWHHFLHDLMRPTGLLTQRGHDLDFLHQTVTEYLAARHATRDDQELLHKLFPPRPRQPQAPALEPSYLGFLLDALLASPDPVPARTTRRLEAFINRGKRDACRFLINQVNLRTNLPPELSARQLARFATSTAYSPRRVREEEDRARMDWSTDRTLGTNIAYLHQRVRAAECLARMDGHRAQGAELLITLVKETSLYSFERVGAAESLAQLEGYRERGAELLGRLAEDTDLHSRDRAEAAESLAQLDGYRERGTELLGRLAEDTTFASFDRFQAARSLAQLEGYGERGAELLGRLAGDATLSPQQRVWAAEELAKLDGYRERGVELLITFAEDTTLNLRWERMQAAGRLARIGEHRDRTGKALIAIAEDTALDQRDRFQAARTLGWVDGYGERGAGLLIAFAKDTTLYFFYRVEAAEHLAEVDGYQERAAGLLIAFAEDTNLDSDHYRRVEAAGHAAKVDGYQERAAELLIAFAKDTTLRLADQVSAAKHLAEVDGYQKRAAELLITLAQDTTLDRRDRYNRGQFDRVQAASKLSWVDGYRDRGAELLIALAQDTTLNFHARRSAAEDLSWVDGYQERAAGLLDRLPDDDAMRGTYRRFRIVESLGRKPWRRIRKVFRGLYLFDWVGPPTRKVRAPRGAGCGYQRAVDSWLETLRRPASHDDSAAD